MRKKKCVKKAQKHFVQKINIFPGYGNVGMVKMAHTVWLTCKLENLSRIPWKMNEIVLPLGFFACLIHYLFARDGLYRIYLTSMNLLRSAVSALSNAFELNCSCVSMTFDRSIDENPKGVV